MEPVQHISPGRQDTNLTSPALQYKLITKPVAGTTTLLAALPGGPGMNDEYLHDLIVSSSSLFGAVGIDWPRKDEDGKTLHKPDLQLSKQADYVESVRQQISVDLGVEARLLPVAHSGSGPRAILWAAQHLEQCAGLVLIDAMISPPKLPYSQAKILFSMGGYCLRHPSNGMGTAALEKAFRATFMEAAGDYYFVRPDKEKKQAFTNAFISPFWPSLMESGFRTWDVQEHLRQLGATNLPILILHGESDQIVSPDHARLQQQLAKPSALLRLIAEAGHLPMMEQPQATAEALYAFLSTLAKEHPISED